MAFILVKLKCISYIKVIAQLFSTIFLKIHVQKFKTLVSCVKDINVKMSKLHIELWKYHWVLNVSKASDSRINPFDRYKKMYSDFLKSLLYNHRFNFYFELFLKELDIFLYDTYNLIRQKCKKWLKDDKLFCVMIKAGILTSLGNDIRDILPCKGSMYLSFLVSVILGCCPVLQMSCLINLWRILQVNVI